MGLFCFSGGVGSVVGTVYSPNGMNIVLHIISPRDGLAAAADDEDDENKHWQALMDCYRVVVAHMLLTMFISTYLV